MMRFNVLSAAIGIVFLATSALAEPPSPTAAALARARTLSDSAFAGHWQVKGQDEDLKDSNFTARHTYNGALDLTVVGDTLRFSGDLETRSSKDGSLIASPHFSGEGPISKNQVAAYYDIKSERATGFGTIFFQFDEAGQKADAYLVFRVAIGKGTVGHAIYRLSREP
jgi:hypothetical protein